MRYVTHPYPDLDAVASLAVLGAAPADVALEAIREGVG